MRMHNWTTCVAIPNPYLIRGVLLLVHEAHELYHVLGVVEQLLGSYVFAQTLQPKEVPEGEAFANMLMLMRSTARA